MLKFRYSPPQLVLLLYPYLISYFQFADHYPRRLPIIALIIYFLSGTFLRIQDFHFRNHIFLLAWRHELCVVAFRKAIQAMPFFEMLDGTGFRELETSPPVDAFQNASQLRQQQRGQDALPCKRFLIRLQALLTRQVYFIDQMNSKKCWVLVDQLLISVMTYQRFFFHRLYIKLQDF